MGNNEQRALVAAGLVLANKLHRFEPWVEKAQPEYFFGLGTGSKNT